MQQEPSSKFFANPDPKITSVAERVSAIIAGRAGKTRPPHRLGGAHTREARYSSIRAPHRGSPMTLTEQVTCA